MLANVAMHGAERMTPGYHAVQVQQHLQPSDVLLHMLPHAADQLLVEAIHAAVYLPPTDSAGG